MGAIHAFGNIRLRLQSTGQNPTFSTVAGIKDLTAPQREAATQDASTFDSADAHREYVVGMIDSGQVSFMVNYDPDRDETFEEILEARAVRVWQVEYGPSSAPTKRRQFSAFVTGFAPGSATVDGLLEATVTLRTTGKVTDVAV